MVKRDREVWRVAMTLANNLCVKASDYYNSDDRTDESHGATRCADRIRDFLDIPDDQLAELLAEGGVTSDGESKSPTVNE